MAALSFFVALETRSPGDADEVCIPIVEEFGEDAILRGLALVAALLRHHLQQHAGKLGAPAAPMSG